MKSIVVLYFTLASMLIIAENYSETNGDNGMDLEINEDSDDETQESTINLFDGFSTTEAEGMSISIVNKNYWVQSVGYNVDATLNFTSLISRHGYPWESHNVTTEDHYILTIYRIAKSKNCNGEMKKTPVIMMHGLADSSDTFIVSGPNASLAYLIADSCYDVWLPNNRGNRYSRRHVHYTADSHSEKYWNFTFDEHGMYDLKAVVDYVLNTTNSQQVSYIGHSQGTTNFYVLTSSRPEYNAKFCVAISLAPISWMSHMRSPLIRLTAVATKELKTALDIARVREIFQRNGPMDKILKYLCQFLPNNLCSVAVMIFSGGDPKTIGADVFKTVFGHYPCATSSKNLVHYGQAINGNGFRRYDYGSEVNFKVYGTREPPDYNVTKITAPVALIASRGDLLSVVEDVATLRAKLPNVVMYREMDKSWGHSHYTWGKTVAKKLAPAVIELLNKYNNFTVSL